MSRVEVVLRVPTAERMRELGAALGQVAQAGDWFLLEGPFGAGKTTFVQGLAHGLGVETPVSSPSFVLETQHRGRLPLYHVDLYRVERLDAELLEALEDHLYAADGVTAVEWSDRLPAELRAGATVRIQVRFGLPAAEGAREVSLASEVERLLAAARRAAGAC